jgi:hypothetical protein
VLTSYLQVLQEPPEQPLHPEEDAETNLPPDLKATWEINFFTFWLPQFLHFTLEALLPKTSSSKTLPHSSHSNS